MTSSPPDWYLRSAELARWLVELVGRAEPAGLVQLGWSGWAGPAGLG